MLIAMGFFGYLFPNLCQGNKNIILEVDSHSPLQYTNLII